MIETTEGRKSRRNFQKFSGFIQMDLDRRSDVSAQFIKIVNYVLNCLYFKLAS